MTRTVTNGNTPNMNTHVWVCTHVQKQTPVGENKIHRDQKAVVGFYCSRFPSLTTVYLHTLINSLCVHRCVSVLCVPLYMLHFRGHKELEPNFVFSLQVRWYIKVTRRGRSMCVVHASVFFRVCVCEVGEHRFPEVGLMKKPFMEKSSSWGDGMRERRGKRENSALCVCLSACISCVYVCVEEGVCGIWPLCLKL